MPAMRRAVLAINVQGRSRLSAARSRLAKFDECERCLRRDYADVFASQEACSHIELVDTVLRNTRAQLRAQLVAHGPQALR